MHTFSGPLHRAPLMEHRISVSLKRAEESTSIEDTVRLPSIRSVPAQKPDHG